MNEHNGLERQAAWWTVVHSDDEPSYYFAPVDRAPGPYTRQREVRAVIDIAEDGTLAGIELIDDMPPPPMTRDLTKS